MKSNSLQDVFMEKLTDMLNAENQLFEVLPKMAKASQSPSLTSILEAHLEVTKEHVFRLQDIFNNISQNPQRVDCQTMKEFVIKSGDVMNSIEAGLTRDTALIKVAQEMEQYEIKMYTNIKDHAADLGHTRIVEVLDKSLDEERDMNLDLSEVAQRFINVQAMNTKTNPNSSLYINEEKFYKKSIKKRGKDPKTPHFNDNDNPNP